MSIFNIIVIIACALWVASLAAKFIFRRYGLSSALSWIAVALVAVALLARLFC